MNIIEWRNYLCQDDKVSSRAKHIGLTLSLFYRQGKRTYPTIDTICQWSSLAPNTVSGALKDLQKSGYIVSKSYRLPNARFRGHEYSFIGVVSDCSVEENPLQPSNLEPTAEAAIEAAIEPSNFAYKIEEEEEKNINKKQCEKLKLLCKKDMDAWLLQMEMQGTPINIDVGLEVEKMKAHYLAYNGLDANGNRIFDWVNKAKTWLIKAQTNKTIAVVAKKNGKLPEAVRTDLLDFRQTPEYKEIQDARLGK